MEHLVQFTVSVDDQTIQKKLEENAYNDVLDILVEKALKGLPVKYTRYTNNDVDWEVMFKDKLDDFVENNRDDIIEAAANTLAESYKRTKAYKEKMSEVMDK